MGERRKRVDSRKKRQKVREKESQWVREKKREGEEHRSRRGSLNLKCKYTQQITIGDRHPYFKKRKEKPVGPPVKGFGGNLVFKTGLYLTQLIG